MSCQRLERSCAACDPVVAYFFTGLLNAQGRLTQQKIACLARVLAGCKNGGLVLFQDLNPAADVIGMVDDQSLGKFEATGKKCGTKFGHQFFERVAEPLAECPVQPAGVPSPVSQFMQGGGIEVGRRMKLCRVRQNDLVACRWIAGMTKSMPDDGTRRCDQLIGGGECLERLSCRSFVGLHQQAVNLPHVEDPEGLAHWIVCALRRPTHCRPIREHYALPPRQNNSKLYPSRPCVYGLP